MLSSVPALCKGGAALGCDNIPANLSSCWPSCGTKRALNIWTFAAAKTLTYSVVCSCITNSGINPFSREVSLLILTHLLKKIYVLQCSVLSISQLENRIVESTQLNLSESLDCEVYHFPHFFGKKRHQNYLLHLSLYTSQKRNWWKSVF